MSETLNVIVDWTKLGPRHSLWDGTFCLYAYLHPENDRILYIGKADYQTVRQRLYGSHKNEIFDFFWRKYGIEKVNVIQGELMLEEGRRRSTELLADVESLLIVRLQPPANIAYTRSRTYRPGLRVRCIGDWPHRRTGFHDWT
jgi:hypothetical protein